VHPTPERVETAFAQLTRTTNNAPRSRRRKPKRKSANRPP